MKVTIDESLKGKELFDFLIANKSLLIAEKKYSIKHSDSFHANVTIQDDGNVTKGAPVLKDDVHLYYRAMRDKYHEHNGQSQRRSYSWYLEKEP
jgi:hypothetical protein